MSADATRRDFIAGSAMLPAAASATGLVNTDARGAVERDLARYVGFGNKQAGGAGDMACGGWLAGELEAAGYRIERQTIEVPLFEPERCELVSGQTSAKVCRSRSSSPRARTASPAL